MSKILKEVNIFSIGNSAKIKTWSNVPFFFTEELIKRGIIVNRVNVAPNKWLEAFYNRIIYVIIRLFNKKSSYEFIRTGFNYYIVRHLVKKADKKYPKADANIFLTFSFSAHGLSCKPSILFCDWTYEHYFNYFENRSPDYLEGKSLKRENKAIENADLVISLFPGVCDYMKSHYKNKNIHYLGNVINSLEKVNSEVISLKTAADNLLFIGSKKYLEGAVNLIKVYEKVKTDYPNSVLHIIGLNNNDFNYIPSGIKCYGYLDKDKNSDRELFYHLLKTARIFINTTPKWGAFSATVEAMYFYTPIIVTPYPDFVKTFGQKINFGYYCAGNSKEMLLELILKILGYSSYEELCMNSNNAVKDFTWDNYIDKVLQKIEEI